MDEEEAIISVRQGNSILVPIECRKPDESPFDLTDSELVAFIEQSDGRVIRKTTADPASGLTITDANGGKATLRILPPETRGLTAGKVSRWEIERRYAGTQITIRHGYFDVEEGINDE